MANKWTTEQLDAINSEGENIIVSAGAGSGKTAVLTERVLRKVRNNVPINKLLILTFTKAAASEMKTRIRKALKKAGLKEQVELIDSSYITTFDSYSLSVVRKYHSYLNVDQDIKITDQALIDIKKKELLDTIMDQKYEENSVRFQNLIAHFALKDDANLKKMILSINNELDLRYDKETYLKQYETDFYSESNINNILKEYGDVIFAEKHEVQELVAQISSELEGKNLEAIYQATSGIINSTDYKSLREHVLSYQSPRKNKEYTETAAILKDSIKKIVDELKDLTVYNDFDEMKNELLESKDDTLEIIDIILRLHQKFEIVKKEESLYDFTDISHLAIKLVQEHEEVRTEIKDSFQEILIDEYQDTSDTQELFISNISNNNVYMVGDIKQSIYRFRNANPYLFKNKYDNYSKSDTAGKKIDLNKNFRSRQEVLSNINLIFNHLMDNYIGGAAYEQEHQMIFGNTTYIKEGYTNQDYNLSLKTYKKDTDFKNIVKEAFIIGNDIKRKISEGYQVFDKEEKVLRNINYSDFAILLDVKKNFDMYKKIFQYLDIPLTLYKDEDLTESTDLLIIRNLVKLIIFVKNNDYNTEFKYTYLSISRSFLFNDSDNDIFEVMKDNSFRSTKIVKLAKSLVDKIDYLPLELLFKEILTTFEYETKLLATNNIEEKEKRLEYLTTLLKSLSDKGYTIYEFAYFLDQVIEEKYNIKYKATEDSSNSVKLMSIHASKGLEFPLCYFANLENKFNQSFLKEKIVYDKEFGIILPIISTEEKLTITSKLYKRKEKLEDISERLRLFYVALTRCKEKMIIVMPEEDENILSQNIVPNFIRRKYCSFKSFITSINSLLHEYNENTNDDNYTKDYLLSIKETPLDYASGKLIKISPHTFTKIAKEEKHFSKSNIKIISADEQKQMSFGTKIHKVLEELDFKNPNLDELDIDSFMKQKIKSFLNQELIKTNIDSKIIKEYEFINDNETQKEHGIIDLLIENEKEIIIIDYKLNNVLDKAYQEQLEGYRMEIMKKTTKPIRLYLYSIIQEQFQEIIN